MKTNWDAAPTYMHREIARRVDYTALPWHERLVAPPPPGWSGSWTARLVSRLVPRPRKSAAKTTTKRASTGARRTK